jgi:hypothetical protein
MAATGNGAVLDACPRAGRVITTVFGATTPPPTGTSRTRSTQPSRPAKASGRVVIVAVDHAGVTGPPDRSCLRAITGPC